MSEKDRADNGLRLSHFADLIIEKYGKSEEGARIFESKAREMSPGTPKSEISEIWGQATADKRDSNVRDQQTDPNKAAEESGQTLRPGDYSDLGQADAFLRMYGKDLLYTEATGFLHFNGAYWVESEQAAVGVMEQFLDRQLMEVVSEQEEQLGRLERLGLPRSIAEGAGRSLEKKLSGELLESYQKYLDTREYYRFVLRRRDMKYVHAALEAAIPKILHDVNELDRDGFLLNTPDGTYNLTRGLSGRQDANAEDYITKQTMFAPGNKGRELWERTVQETFMKDQALINYVQEIVGLAAIGKVFFESMIIAYGAGRNGKSTFWNSIARALGSYSGVLSSDTLIIGTTRNAKPEMAELKGKRLVIASELDEGHRLNTGFVKQVCSTDEIVAEKKYKAPFRFIPSHMLVLYTNHLPKVSAMDDGTWRRLTVIPFQAKIEGSDEVKNYTEFLLEHAGPAIIAWVIEGAKKAIELNFKFEMPAAVEAAIGAYRAQNDWLSEFFEDCCEIGSEFSEKSGRFYEEYRASCQRKGEYTRSTTDFYTALENAGYQKVKNRQGMMILGVRLKERWERAEERDIPFYK